MPPPGPAPLSGFVESISAAWRQHAIPTGSPAVAAAAYCVPFTLLDSSGPSPQGPTDKGPGEGPGRKDGLPIAVDATLSHSSSSDTHLPQAPTALKRIRSGDAFPRPSNPHYPSSGPFALVSASCCRPPGCS